MTPGRSSRRRRAAQPVLSTSAYDVDRSEIESRIAQIISDNAAEASPQAAAHSSLR